AITAREGEDVPVGQRVAVILAAGESAVPAAGRGPAASPLARRLAAEAGVPLDGVAGTGPGGAVKAADVRSAATASPAPAPASATWATMARRTTESWTTIPHFSLEREVDAGRLESWRAAARRTGAEVTITDLLVRLAAACLPRHPLVNGRWDGTRTVAAEGVHVGIAVAVEQGLVVPVVRDADGLSLAQVAERRRDLVERARSGRLRPDDLAGATFTISNLGMYAVDAFRAIVDRPQAAILAVGRVADRVVPVDGVPQVRRRVRLTLSCDHRAVDGARAAAFLTDLGDLIEEPAALL
ncbi:MAG TPA: dihydrolipoamide acetyltransferase family protein, partial [Candidatus Dormibacteraeota bacterium]|nr:dihydrolipoamide acetyltransferase family protein [Candidatus Dormibacteraeota bacterium]